MRVTELREKTAWLRETVGLRDEPLAFFYTDNQPEGYRPEAGQRACVIEVLSRARRGETVYFDREHCGCGGSEYYLGFAPPREGIEFFVSTGIPGKMPGERYKKSADLVRAYMERNPVEPAPATYAVFKPVAALAENDRPAIIICFGDGDALAGLVGLAGYARAEDAVICPFGSGCGTIVARPLAEAKREVPRAVLGMFDPSARPFVEGDRLSFAAPLALWEEMLGNAAGSFLGTPTWRRVRERSGG